MVRRTLGNRNAQPTNLAIGDFAYAAFNRFIIRILYRSSSSLLIHHYCPCFCSGLLRRIKVRDSKQFVSK
jgi:hypothetical protein